MFVLSGRMYKFAVIQVTGVIFIPVKGNPVKGRNCTCSCISRLVSVTFCHWMFPGRRNRWEESEDLPASFRVAASQEEEPRRSKKILHNEKIIDVRPFGSGRLRLAGRDGSG